MKNVPNVTEQDILFVETHGKFTRREKWGDIYQVRRPFFYVLHFWRMRLGVAIYLHAVKAIAGHSNNSYHYKGLAGDLHIADYSLTQQATSAVDEGFTGIGVYPWWHRPGLHVDMRHLDGGESVYWISHKKDEYTYFADVDKFLSAVASLEDDGKVWD